MPWFRSFERLIFGIGQRLQHPEPKKPSKSMSMPQLKKDSSVVAFKGGSGALLEAPDQMGVSENRGTLFWGPYNKDPTI